MAAASSSSSDTDLCLLAVCVLCTTTLAANGCRPPPAGKHRCPLCDDDAHTYDSIDDLVVHQKDKDHWGGHFDGGGTRRLPRKTTSYIEDVYEKLRGCGDRGGTSAVSLDETCRRVALDDSDDPETDEPEDATSADAVDVTGDAAASPAAASLVPLSAKLSGRFAGLPDSLLGTSMDPIKAAQKFGASSVVVEARKAMRRLALQSKGPIYTYFVLAEGTLEEPELVECRLCGAKLKWNKKSNSNLYTHVESSPHPELAPRTDTYEAHMARTSSSSSSLKQTTLTSSQFPVKLTPGSPEYAEAVRLFALALADTNTAFNFADNVNVRRLLTYLRPGFAPSADVVMRETLAQAQVVMRRVAASLASDCVAAAVADDGWSSRKRDSYLGTLLIYIDDEFDVRCAAVGLRASTSSPQSAEGIAASLEATLATFDALAEECDVTGRDGKPLATKSLIFSATSDSCTASLKGNAIFMSGAPSADSNPVVACLVHQAALAQHDWVAATPIVALMFGHLNGIANSIHHSSAAKAAGINVPVWVKTRFLSREATVSGTLGCKQKLIDFAAGTQASPKLKGHVNNIVWKYVEVVHSLLGPYNADMMRLGGTKGSAAAEAVPIVFNMLVNLRSAVSAYYTAQDRIGLEISAKLFAAARMRLEVVFDDTRFRRAYLLSPSMSMSEFTTVYPDPSILVNSKALVIELAVAMAERFPSLVPQPQPATTKPPSVATLAAIEHEGKRRRLDAEQRGTDWRDRLAATSDTQSTTVASTASAMDATDATATSATCMRDSGSVLAAGTAASAADVTAGRHAALTAAVTNELEKYLSLDRATMYGLVFREEGARRTLEPLECWKRLKKDFPCLSLAARAALVVQPSQLSAERMFSRAACIMRAARYSMSASTLQHLILLALNARVVGVML